MDTKKINLKQQLALWAEGKSEDACHGFYDWFCSDRGLENRAKRLRSSVRTFLKSLENAGQPLNLENHYVFFKNNCPMSGSLYDSFSVCDLEEGDVKFWVTPRSGHTRAEGRAEIWIAEKDLELEAQDYRSLLKGLKQAL